MTGRDSLSAARAARRAAVTLAAVVALATSAAAHGPTRKQLRTEPPPGTDVPVSVPLAPGAVSPAPPANAGAVPTTGVRPLRVLAAEAAVVALGDVSRTEVYDEGRLELHRVRVERVLRGRLDAGEVGVVEIRGDSRRPPLLAEGDHGVVLLRPAEGGTYLRNHLSAEDHFELVGGRDGMIRVAGAADLEAIERTLADAAASADLAPPAAIAARRHLAFTELAAPSPRLAADALIELRLLPALAPLDPEEHDALRRALRDTTIDAGIRIGLIELVAERNLTEVLPVLSAAAADTPAVLTALLAARAGLGAPAGRAELAPYLADRDPAIRAAAVRALARLDGPEALAEVASHATDDPDAAVRAAAVEALGQTKRPEAVPVLIRTFDVPEREIRQKSAQAMLAIGGPTVENALVDLALRSRSTETQKYAALLLIASVGRDHPAVRRIEASNPGPEVRDLLEHGLEFHDTHRH